MVLSHCYLVPSLLIRIIGNMIYADLQYTEPKYAELESTGLKHDLLLRHTVIEENDAFTAPIQVVASV